MRKLDELETYNGLLNEFASAKREFAHKLGELERAEATGNRKMVFDRVSELSRLEARCIRLDRLVSRCREAIASHNPFIRAFKAVDRLNEPGTAKDLTGWIVWTNEVI
jgi:hypothetical protein